MMISVWNSWQGPGCAAAAIALPGRFGGESQITALSCTEAEEPDGNELGGGALEAEALGGVVKGRGADVAVPGFASFHIMPLLSGAAEGAEALVDGAGVGMIFEV